MHRSVETGDVCITGALPPSRPLPPVHLCILALHNLSRSLSASRSASTHRGCRGEHAELSAIGTAEQAQRQWCTPHARTPLLAGSSRHGAGMADMAGIWRARPTYFAHYIAPATREDGEPPATALPVPCPASWRRVCPTGVAIPHLHLPMPQPRTSGRPITLRAL